MPTYNIDLQDLLYQAFDVIGIRSYFPPLPPLGGTSLPQYIPGQLFPSTKEDARSQLGTPIHMPVAFEQASWQDINDAGEKIIVSAAGFTLPAATVIDFQQEKVIERTEIAGRKGTVKEYIGIDDWEIRIRGVIVNELDPYNPDEQMIRMMHGIKQAPVSIAIINDMCLWLDIYDVVIRSIQFPALEGYPGVQPFIIECWSEESFELKYRNGL